VTLELAESLLLSEAVSPRAIARGLFLQATQQMSFVQALLVTGVLDEAKIEDARQLALNRFGPGFAVDKDRELIHV